MGVGRVAVPDEDPAGEPQVPPHASEVFPGQVFEGCVRDVLVGPERDGGMMHTPGEPRPQQASGVELVGKLRNRSVLPTQSAADDPRRLGRLHRVGKHPLEIAPHHLLHDQGAPLCSLGVWGSMRRSMIRRRYSSRASTTAEKCSPSRRAWSMAWEI